MFGVSLTALCEGVQCAFGAHCAAGECVCPTDCTGAAREPVCGSTMQTFPNECELQKAACRLPPPATLHVIFYGDCKDRLAVVPPIAMSTYHKPYFVLLSLFCSLITILTFS